MTLREYALDAANIADKLTYESRVRTVDGQKVVIVPYDEATSMKDQLVKISHCLYDIADADSASSEGAD